MDKKSRLKQLARAALIRTRGDVTRAIERLDTDVIKSDDIELERELTATYREYALRAVLHSNLTDLQSEGIIPRERDQREPQTAAQPRTWAVKRVAEMERRARNYLDDFKVNGEPIGDLTAETVLMKAEVHERDARFMRLVASGVPPTGRIRDYVTPEEAEQRWKMAREEPVRDPRAEGIMKMLARGRKLRPDEYEAAQQRVRELEKLDKQTAWDSFELDALARVMSEYEADG